jgi:magnesium chelatase subunit I
VPELPLEPMERVLFPFSALVGQESLRLALLVTATEPSLGGLLISGTKGTGKSTAVRALRGILPPIEAVAGCPYHCPPDEPSAMDTGCLKRHRAGETLARERIPVPFVELPLNATEDRVAGTLDVERALAAGERRFEPGLLAAANRGFLYVDEVNLLDDHLVDLLLDAAASGVHVVEREGISHAHPARFALIGTMNPEEGSLRPQFLDRFGLFASVPDLTDLDQREEIARRRLAFDADPAALAARFAPDDVALAQRLARAQRALPSVQVPEPMLSLAVRLAAKSGARGHRAEIAILKAARAVAALLGRPAVDPDALADAARFVLPHRMPAGPLDTPERLEQRLGELVDGMVLGRQAAAEDEDERARDDAALEESLLSMQIPGAAAAGSILFSAEKKTPKTGSSSPAS